MNRMKTKKKKNLEREASLDGTVSKGLSEEVIFDLRQEAWKEPAKQRAGVNVIGGRNDSRKPVRLGEVGVFEVVSAADAC